MTLGRHVNATESSGAVSDEMASCLVLKFFGLELLENIHGLLGE